MWTTCKLAKRVSSVVRSHIRCPELVQQHSKLSLQRGVFLWMSQHLHFRFWFLFAADFCSFSIIHFSESGSCQMQKLLPIPQLLLNSLQYCSLQKKIDPIKINAKE
uniref:Uncharacterized protein n=1 Tax=Percolomonas cosmopolitus TaxID=63605 RepID=A0A7S1KT33_9EUKA